MNRWGYGIVAVALCGVVACSSEPGGDPASAAERAVTSYIAAWSSGRPDRLAALTDNAKAAEQTVETAAADLGITRTRVEPVGEPECADAGCRQRLRVTHTLDGLGDWTYETSIELRARGDRPHQVVHWTPSAFHPSLTPQRKFRKVRELPDRASILDRDGKAITKERPVVRILLDPAKVTDATYAALSRHLGLGGDALRKKVAAAEGAGPVPAITVREALWANIAGHLKALPGLVAEEGTLSLGPSSSFARGIIGGIGIADDPKTLDNAGPGFLAHDDVGLSGLQRTFQRQLGGRPGGHLELYEPATGDITNQLVEVKSKPGKPVKTTLSLDLQTAAEAAVVGADKPTAVVAVRASTGEILAAAGGPGATPFNRGFEGKYPPGSTFKVLSAAALLENGLKPGDPVTCPAEVNIGGKRFKNAYDMAQPDGPFVNAFAHSCNTTMVARAESVTGEDLTAMAGRFGIGEKWDVGLPAYSGSVPEPGDLVDRAATMIGQGRVLMSPLGMALVAATVDSGQPRTPSLLADRPGRTVGEKLPADLHNSLRDLMRAVVTTGSAKQVLAGLPGEIHAKTGTAEYGTANPPRTHAWMIGFRDDLAFAVVIEDGGAGGKDAGPVVRRFLQSAAA